MDNSEETMGFLKYARMNDNQKLQDLLTTEEYARIEQYFANNKMMLPLSMINRFKPYFISSLISERLMDCPKKKSMEELIMTEGKKYNKEIKGIETVAYQAGLFDSIPYKKQAKDLLTYIDSIDHYKSTTLKLAEALQTTRPGTDGLAHREKRSGHGRIHGYPPVQPQRQLEPRYLQYLPGRW